MSGEREVEGSFYGARPSSFSSPIPPRTFALFARNRVVLEAGCVCYFVRTGISYRLRVPDSKSAVRDSKLSTSTPEKHPRKLKRDSFHKYSGLLRSRAVHCTFPTVRFVSQQAHSGGKCTPIRRAS